MFLQIVHPFAYKISGEDHRDAIRKFIKIKHHLGLESMIYKDQIANNYFEAQFKYYMNDGRKRVGIDYYPAPTALISKLNLPPMSAPVKALIESSIARENANRSKSFFPSQLLPQPGVINTGPGLAVPSRLSPLLSDSRMWPTGPLLSPTGPMLSPAHVMSPIGPLLSPARVMSPMMAPAMVSSRHGIVASVPMKAEMKEIVSPGRIYAGAGNDHVVGRFLSLSPATDEPTNKTLENAGVLKTTI